MAIKTSPYAGDPFVQGVMKQNDEMSNALARIVDIMTAAHVTWSDLTQVIETARGALSVCEQVRAQMPACLSKSYVSKRPGTHYPHR